MRVERSPGTTLFAVLLFCILNFPLLAQDALVQRVDSLNKAYSKAEERSLTEAEKVCTQALALAEKIGYSKGKADAHSNLGLVFLRRSNSAKAIEQFFTALKLYEQLQGYTEMEQYGSVLVRLGGINYFDGQFDKSLLYLRKGLKLAEQNNFTRLQGISCRVIGEVHRDNGRYDSASHYFNRALKCFEGDMKNLGAVYIDIGLNYYYQKDYKKAIEYNKKFYSNARIRGNETDYAPGLHNIGEFYYQLGDYDSALVYLDSALVYSTKFKQGGSLVDTYRVKAKVFRAMKLADSVAVYFQKSITLKDSLRSDTYQKELASLNAQLDLYKHESENALLKKDQRITVLYRNLAIIGLVAVGAVLGLVLIRQKLRVQKKVKEKLEDEVKQRTSEIADQNAVIEKMNLRLQLALSRSKVDPHFVFNVLNSIQHLVIEKKPQEASDHLARLSRLTRYILEKSSLEEVALDAELKMLEQYIRLEQLRLDNRFEYSVSVQAEEGIFIPAMIIQPYIENAILHGLAPAKKTDLLLRLNIVQAGSQLTVEITDNGVGRGNKAPRKDHHSIGGSLGSHRLAILSRLEGREFNCEYEDLFDQGEPAGTRVILQVPVKIGEVI
jgi:sensor histidine kinase YesM